MTRADYEHIVVLSSREDDNVGSHPIRPRGADKVTGGALNEADFRAVGLLHG